MSERYIGNPLRVLRGVLDLVVIKADKALSPPFDPRDYMLPDYKAEAPVATEEELNEGDTR